MIEISTPAPYVPVRVAVGDEVIEGRLDVTAVNRVAIARKCAGAAKESAWLQEQFDKAKREGDYGKLPKLVRKMSAIGAAAVEVAYGREFLDAVVGACGGREEAAFEPLMRLLQAAREAVEGFLTDEEVSATQYLAEVERGADEPAQEED